MIINYFFWNGQMPKSLILHSRHTFLFKIMKKGMIAMQRNMTKNMIDIKCPKIRNDIPIMDIGHIHASIAHTITYRL